MLTRLHVSQWFRRQDDAATDKEEADHASAGCPHVANDGQLEEPLIVGRDAVAIITPVEVDETEVPSNDKDTREAPETVEVGGRMEFLPILWRKGKDIEELESRSREHRESRQVLHVKGARWLTPSM